MTIASSGSVELADAQVGSTPIIVRNHATGVYSGQLGDGVSGNKLDGVYFLSVEGSGQSIARSSEGGSAPLSFAPGKVTAGRIVLVAANDIGTQAAPIELVQGGLSGVPGTILTMSAGGGVFADHGQGDVLIGDFIGSRLDSAVETDKLVFRNQGKVYALGSTGSIRRDATVTADGAFGDASGVLLDDMVQVSDRLALVSRNGGIGGSGPATIDQVWDASHTGKDHDVRVQVARADAGSDADLKVTASAPRGSVGVRIWDAAGRTDRVIHLENFDFADGATNGALGTYRLYSYGRGIQPSEGNDAVTAAFGDFAAAGAVQFKGEFSELRIAAAQIGRAGTVFGRREAKELQQVRIPGVKEQPFVGDVELPAIQAVEDARGALEVSGLRRAQFVTTGDILAKLSGNAIGDTIEVTARAQSGNGYGDVVLSAVDYHLAVGQAEHRPWLANNFVAWSDPAFDQAASVSRNGIEGGAVVLAAARVSSIGIRESAGRIAPHVAGNRASISFIGKPGAYPIAATGSTSGDISFRAMPGSTTYVYVSDVYTTPAGAVRLWDYSRTDRNIFEEVRTISLTDPQSPLLGTRGVCLQTVCGGFDGLVNNVIAKEPEKLLKRVGLERSNFGGEGLNLPESCDIAVLREGNITCQ